MKKKLKLEGKNMLNKEQLREIKGGYDEICYNAPYEQPCYCPVPPTGTSSGYLGCMTINDCNRTCQGLGW